MEKKIGGKKVLIVLTNQGHYPERKESTGLWFGELVHFYDPLHQAGYEMDFVSPQGGEVPIDPQSLGKMFMDKVTRRYYEDPEFRQRLEHTLSPDQVKPEEYGAVYYTGGHGTMWDFPGEEALGKISARIHQNGGVVSAVCHGACGLLNIPSNSGGSWIAGKKLTGFSNLEETMALKKDLVPFLLEDALKQKEAKYEKAFFPFKSHVVTDQGLVTGQNPASAKGVAKAVLALLKKQ